MAYHPKGTFVSKDPDKRANQLANLRRGRKPGKKIAVIEKHQLKNASIIEFCEEWLGLSLHPAQRVVLKSIYGLKLDKAELGIYSQITGGLTAQHGISTEALEAVLAIGARSGKSLMAAVIALYESVCHSHVWRQHLAKNETGYAVVVATKQKQAEDIIQRNAARMLQDSPKLKGWLDAEPTKSELTLTNGLKIISLPCSSSAGRGLPIFTLIQDELAHWFTEGAKCDSDIYDSLSPRLLQFPGAKTIFLSTPAAKRGLFWEWFKEGFTVPRRATFQAPNFLMNPNLDRDFLARMEARDPDNYRRECLAEFAEQVSAFFPYDPLMASFQLAGDVPPQQGIEFVAGVDQSGLTGRDRFGFAIAHRDIAGKVILDVARSFNSTDSDIIMQEINTLREAYRVEKVLVDAYAGGWCRQALEKIGFQVDKRDPLPQVYINGKSLMLAGKLILPDNGELRAGLQNTQAYYGRNNSLSIQHERSAAGHADLADSTLTAAWAASAKPAEWNPRARML